MSKQYSNFQPVSEVPGPEVVKAVEAIENSYFEPFQGRKWFDAATDAGLDPVIGAVATSPGGLERRSYDALLKIAGTRLYDAMKTPLDGTKEVNPKQEAVDRRLNELRRDSQEVLEKGSGIATVTVALLGAGVAAYGFNELLLDPTDAAYASLESNTKLSDDDSIFPGDFGTFEVLGLEMGIPGFRDVPTRKKVTTSYESTTDVVVEDSVQESAQVERGENDPALDLKLTGNEYAQDTEAVQRIIEEIVSVGLRHRITSVKVVGMASDEIFDGGTDGLGVSNDENISLAEQRAVVGALAFEDVAGSYGLEIPEIQISSNEVLLTSDEISRIDEVAGSLGISRAELIQQYNRNPEVFTDEINVVLEEMLQRGVSYQVNFERTTSKTETLQTVVEVKNESFAAGLPSEALALPAMVSLAGVFVALFQRRINNMLAKHIARKQIKNATKTIS